MNEDKSIKIIVTRELDENGRIGYRIMNICGPARDELPLDYLNYSSPTAYVEPLPESEAFEDKNCLYTQTREGDYNLLEGSFVYHIFMNGIMNTVSTANNNLAIIEAKTKSLAPNWNGDAVFVNGLET